MKLEDIEAFLMIADTHNLSKSAQLLYITQSTVSYRLKRLETELGVELVKRSRGERSITLTPKGIEFISIAQQWVNVSKYTRQFKEMKSYMNVRIEHVDWFTAYPFQKFYELLLEKEPLLKLHIRTGHSAPISEKVNNVEIDIGFVVHPIITSSLVYRPLFRDPLVMICSRRANRQGVTVHPKDLDPLHEVYWPYQGDDVRKWRDQWWDSSIIPLIQMDFSIPTSFYFLSNPEKWMLSPRSIAEEQVQLNPDLKIYTFSVPAPDIICYCIHKKEPSQQAILSIDIIHKQLDTYSDIFIKHDYMKIPENHSYSTMQHLE
ncbi:MAG: LysR family transcriptional regulator [Lachnospiraceae bacterium]|nr:LysR family transcriptional regulator [Lachnospiraceae bacterium]